MIPNEELFQVKAPYFYAGVVIENNKVTTVAPILKYMKGWSQTEVQRYCDNKGWYFEKVDTSNAMPPLLR